MIDLPVCGFCSESIEVWQRSTTAGEAMHAECATRLIIGSVAHIERRCSCYVPGSEAGDPPHLTLRQAAQAAVALWLKSNGNGGPPCHD